MNALRNLLVVLIAATVLLLSFVNFRTLQLLERTFARQGASEQAISILHSGHAPALALCLVAACCIAGCLPVAKGEVVATWPTVVTLFAVLVGMVLQVVVMRSVMVPFVGFP